MTLYNIQTSIAKNKNGEIVIIEKAVKGIKYYCIDEGCDRELILRRGNINIEHFSHKSNCNGISGGESWQHKYCKEFIKKFHNKINIDVYNKCNECKLVDLIHSIDLSNCCNFDEEVKLPNSNYIVDLLCKGISSDDEGKYVIEIFHTHRTDAKKCNFITSKYYEDAENDEDSYILLELNTKDILSNRHKLKQVDDKIILKSIYYYDMNSSDCINCIKRKYLRLEKERLLKIEKEEKEEKERLLKIEKERLLKIEKERLLRIKKENANEWNDAINKMENDYGLGEYR